MDNLEFAAQDGMLTMNHDYSHSNRPGAYTSMPSYLPPTWPLTTNVLDDEEEVHRGFAAAATNAHPSHIYPMAAFPRRHNTPDASQGIQDIRGGVGLSLATANMTGQGVFQHAWQMGFQPQLSHQNYAYDSISDSSYDDCSLSGPLGSSPVDCIPVTTAAVQMPIHMTTAGHSVGPYMMTAGAIDTVNGYTYPMHGQQLGMMQFQVNAMSAMVGAQAIPTTLPQVTAGGSPTSSTFEVSSITSENGWTAINYAHPQGGLNPAGPAVFNPGETLHIRSDSNSSSNGSDHTSGSYEDMPFPMHSPVSDQNNFDIVRGQAVSLTTHEPQSCSDHDYSTVPSPDNCSPAVSPPSTNSRPVLNMRTRPLAAPSASTSPTRSSPPNRRRKSPTEKSAIAKTTPAVIKKPEPTTVVRKAIGPAAEKRVGRRKGPLQPHQRQQAHEIRKLRACLRCKFLKKTCDKGDPCAGCRPSHARLWQVPCTRIDIKDIGYFVNDWEYDFKRHVTLGLSVNNVKGFSQTERTVYITHGFGFFLPIAARDVYVNDDSCFEVDWIETSNMNQYGTVTSKLSTGIAGVPTSKLSEYIDRHLDEGFDNFMELYFEGTPFLTQILLTARDYYRKTQNVVVRKALKLVIAYCLTVHITLVQGLSEEEQAVGLIDDDNSRYHGKTVAPVMINFEVKCALAKMWRELQRDVLEELSGLYSSVYQGDKLRNWPTIFMVASLLLAVWELMQFDCYYREPDEKKVEKFCDDMESTPVGVIVGLFQAISQKLPSFMEWDTAKHAQVLNNNQPICEALTEARKHVEKHESYLRGRSEAKYDRDDFDCLSNKFLSKLVIRAN